MVSLCVSVITHLASLLTANKRLCVCHGIRVTLRCLSLSPPSSPPSSLTPPHNRHFVAPLSSLHPPTPPHSFPLSLPPLLLSLSLWCLPVVCVLQASVGWRHSPQAAEHLPFFTQGGRGERLPADSHQQSHHRQRGQSQGPRYSSETMSMDDRWWLYLPLRELYLLYTHIAAIINK